MTSSVLLSGRSSWREFLQDESLLKNAIRLQGLLRTIQRHCPTGSRLLEAGFGSGSTGVLLADLGYCVTLLDIDAELIELFQSRFPGYVRAGRVRVIRGDMYDLPFARNALDAVYHQGVLEHLDDGQIVRALQEQGRVAPLVIVDVPNSRYPDQPYGDERRLPVGKWRDLIENAGLRIVGMSGRRWARWTYALPHALFLPPLTDRWSRWCNGVSIFICRRQDTD